MRIIKCDRCGAVIPNDSDNIGYVAINLRDIDTNELVDDNPFESWDFCDDCLKAIHGFITDPKAKKFEEILESVDAGKKPVAKKKQVPNVTPDYGKAQALRDAGWTITQIAAEIKASKSAIYANTHKPAEKKRIFPHEWAEKEPDLDPGIKETMEAKQHAVLDIAVPEN